MTQKNKTFALLAAIVVLIGVAAVAYRSLSGKTSPLPSQPAAESQPEEEKLRLPDFTVTNAAGETVQLSSFYGKPIVLNFWATWCSYCKDEMPHFQKVSDEVGDSVQFLMLNATDGKRETVAGAKAYLEEKGYTFTPLFDTEDMAGANAVGVRSYPTTVFLDAEGYVVAAQPGILSEELLRRGIELLTEEKQPA